MATMKRNRDMERALYEVLNDIIYWYEHCQWDLDTYLSERRKRLFEHAYWKRVPSYMRYALRIMEQYRLEQLGREHLYFAYVIDGKPTTFEQWRKDNPDGDALEVFNMDRERGTFWKSTNKPHHVHKG